MSEWMSKWRKELVTTFYVSSPDLDSKGKMVNKTDTDPCFQFKWFKKHDVLRCI